MDSEDTKYKVFAVVGRLANAEKTDFNYYGFIETDLPKDDGSM